MRGHIARGLFVLHCLLIPCARTYCTGFVCIALFDCWCSCVRADARGGVLEAGGRMEQELQGPGRGTEGHLVTIFCPVSSKPEWLKTAKYKVQLGPDVCTLQFLASQVC